MAARTTESKHGIEIAYEGRRIVGARFRIATGEKTASGQAKKAWIEIDPIHYGSIASLKEGKELKRQELRVNAQPGRLYNAPSDLILDDYWPQVLEARRDLKATTRRDYEYLLSSHWFDPIRRMKVIDIRGEHIQALAESMRTKTEAKGKQLNPSTLKTRLTPLGKVFTHAIKVDRIYRGVNPVQTLEIKAVAGRHVKRPCRLYTDADMKLLTSELNERNEGIVMFAWYSGGRQSELLGLRWQHLLGWDVNEGRAGDTLAVLFGEQLHRNRYEQRRVQGTKTQIEGTISQPEDAIPLSPAARVVLRKQWERCRRMDAQGDPLPEGVTRIVRPEDPVFPDITHGSIQEYLRRLGQRLGSRFDGKDGYRPLCLHLMRHQFGSRMAQVAMPGAVAKMMRDSIKTVQDTYQHEFESQHMNPAFSPATILNVSFE